jgi:hypothetical protein
MVNYCHSRLCRRVVFGDSLTGDGQRGPQGATQTWTCQQLGSDCCTEGGTVVGMCDNCRRVVKGNKEDEEGVMAGAGDPVSVGSDDECSIVGKVGNAMLDAVRVHSSMKTAASGGGLTMRKLASCPAVKAALKTARRSLQEGGAEAEVDAEYVVAALLCEGLLEISFNFTPYTTLCYMAIGPASASTPTPTSMAAAVASMRRRHFLLLPVLPPSPPQQRDQRGMESMGVHVNVKRKAGGGGASNEARVILNSKKPRRKDDSTDSSSNGSSREKQEEAPSSPLTAPHNSRSRRRCSGGDESDDDFIIDLT